MAGNTVDLFGAKGAAQALGLIEEARKGVLKQAETVQQEWADIKADTAQATNRAEATIAAMTAAGATGRIVPTRDAAAAAWDSLAAGESVTDAATGAIYLKTTAGQAFPAAPVLSLRGEIPPTPERNADALPSAFPQGFSVMPDLLVEQGIKSLYPTESAGSLLNLRPGNPDGALQLYKRWRSGELFVRGYRADEGWLDWMRLAHSGNIGAQFCLTTLHEDYRIDNTGATDVTADLNRLIAEAHAQGLDVFLSPGTYLITGAVRVFPGQKVYGVLSGLDAPGKGNTGVGLTGTVLLMRGQVQFQMDGGSEFFGVTMFYDQQNYKIVDDPAQPDGLSPLVKYPPTFLLIGVYNGAKIHDILYLGGSHFCDQKLEASNPEKTAIYRIYGMFTDVFLSLHIVSDIPQVFDIFMNANSLHGIIANAGGDAINFHTKLAKNATMFRLGRVDDLHVYRAFVYGVKTYVEWRRSADSRDSGQGGGAQFVHCAADAVAYAFDVGRSDMRGFSVRVVGGWFTPLVKRWVEGSAAVPETATPALVRLRRGARHNVLQFSNVTVFGDAVPQIRDSGQRWLDFQADTETEGNLIQLTNYATHQLDIFADEFYRFMPDETSEQWPRIQYSNVVFKGQPFTHGGRYSGSVTGTVPQVGATVQLFRAEFDGRFTHSTGSSVCRVAAAQETIIGLYVGERKIAAFYWPANKTVGDPVFCQGLDSTFKRGDLIRAVVETGGGIQDAYWEAPMRSAQLG